MKFRDTLNCCDLRLGKKLKLQTTQGKIDFVIQNAFDKYNDYSARNEFKTRVFIQLQLDFLKGITDENRLFAIKNASNRVRRFCEEQGVNMRNSYSRGMVQLSWHDATFAA